MNQDPLLEKIRIEHPGSLLDVGCGCGEFTALLAPYCTKVTAIDSSAKLIERCQTENPGSNITYMCMDGTALKFPDRNFDIVTERASLHHIHDWKKTLDEMCRVSSNWVLITEPLDDIRSTEKQNMLNAEKFYLEVQHEAGYEHYLHYDPQAIKEYFEGRNMGYECQITKYDDLIEPDEYFEMFNGFAEKTKRKEYWIGRLEEFKEGLNSTKLAANDVVYIFAKVNKNTAPNS